MPLSNQRTLSVAVSGLLSISIATTALPTAKLSSRFNIPQSSFTVSTDSPLVMHSLQLFSSDNRPMLPYEEAIALFGQQSDFSAEELETYWEVINSKSEKTAINIFDLF